MQEIEITKIGADGNCQLRAAESSAVIADYAAALNEEATFPPVTVFRDTLGGYWLADGFHRLAAHKQAGRETILAEVRDGDRREAMLFAAGANAAHGLRRTQEDKRQAILALLRDREWCQWSDREIAKRTATDHKTVGKLRREISGGGGEIPKSREAGGGGETPKGAKTDLTARVVAGLPDEALLAEVARRGWEVVI